LATVVGTFIVGLVASQPARAQLVVIDPANVFQTLQVDLQQVNSYEKQVMQYETQIMQYENMIQNTVQAPFTIIQNAQRIVGNLITTINTLSALEAEVGGLVNYLGQFQNLASYKTNSCFQRSGCTPAALAALQKSITFSSAAQKQASDAAIQNVNAQQAQIVLDAEDLQTLQSNARAASGQMEALQYANQLAALQAQQLLQIRAILIAQQNMTATQAQAAQASAAQQNASSSLNHTLTTQQAPTTQAWLVVP
jgi:P-type conjugative transfer protein TrbJ